MGKTARGGRTVEQLLVQLGQLAVRLLGICDEELVDDPLAEHLAHDVPQEALHDESEARVVEAGRVQRLQERRVGRVVEVRVERFGERDQREVRAER